MLFKKYNEPARRCAFCGERPGVSRCGDQKELLVYRCTRCQVTPVRMDEAKLNERAARKIWNKRTEEAEFVLLLNKSSQTNMNLWRKTNEC